MSSQVSSQSHGSSLPSSFHEKDGAAVFVQARSEDGAGGIDGAYSQTISKGIEQVNVTWTAAEERKVVLKVDMVLMPLFAVMFAWMAIDRTNISGVLTTTFLKDTKMTKDQANTGVSILWLGIVLLEIPSNMILHRIGAHYWIPCQVIVWGLIETLQLSVRNSSGWYAARFFLGLAESGFIPGSLYTLSRWYTQDEMAKRAVIFFFGAAASASFGSLLSAGAIRLGGSGGLKSWQWIFLVCGLSTIATGIIALIVLPESPHATGRYFAGFVKGPAWLSERDADVFVARLARKDPNHGRPSTLKITVKDIIDVLTSWVTWPYLLVCLSGLQSINGLATWGATIIKSLGFSSIRANLLIAPSPILASVFGFTLAIFVDRYKRFGYAIMFAAVWTLAGLIALYHLPVTSKASWSFYAALLFTQAAPSWQPLNVVWLSLNFKTPQKRAIAYAVYIGCSNLGGTYGNQVFRGSDAPLYRNAWAACLSLGAVWLAALLAQTVALQLANKRFARRVVDDPGLAAENAYVDKRGHGHRYFW